MHVDGIDDDGNETLPLLTVRPLEKVGELFIVRLFDEFVPIVALPETESVPTVSVPVTDVLENV